MTLTDGEARGALVALRSDLLDEAGVEVALGRLLADLPQTTSPRPRLLVPALGLGAVILLVLGVVFGMVLGTGSQRGGGISPGAAPVPSMPGGGLATGLDEVSSLVDVDGYLWAAGHSQQGGDAELVHAQISTRLTTNSVLMTTKGFPVGVSHLATADGRVYGVTADGGVESFRSDGSEARTRSAAQLGSSAESIAASPGTGLWLLSCCGAAPAGQGLVQQRDASSLAALGLPREFAPFGGTLAAGPAGVWFLDGDSGEIRRVSSADLPAADPQVEENSGQLSQDQLAVGTTGPVLAKAHELLTVDAKTLAVRRAPIPTEPLAAAALSVVGNTAYLAFPDRVDRYDLTTMTETGSFAVTRVTALAAGSDGVWAATGGRLVRLDTLPVLPPAPTATYRSIATGLTGINDLVDVDDHLWLSTGTNLSRVDLADGTLHPERPGDNGLLSTDGSTVFLDHGHPGVVQRFAASGEALQSRTLDAIDIAASRAGLAVLSCCDTGTPTQHIRIFDPTTLTQIGRQVDIPSQGEGGQLIAGDAGLWFLPEDARTIYRLDTSPIRASPLMPVGRQTAALAAMGSRGPVVVTADGELSTIDGSTVSSFALPEGETAPQALTVSGTTVYVAFTVKIIRYATASADAGVVIPISGVTAMTAGPEGVWAAADGNLVQVARP